jgi:hypothetical protein
VTSGVEIVGRREELGRVFAAIESGEESGACLEEGAVLLAELAGDAQGLLKAGLGLGVVPLVRGDGTEVPETVALEAALADLAGDAQGFL